MLQKQRKKNGVSVFIHSFHHAWINNDKKKLFNYLYINDEQSLFILHIQINIELREKKNYKLKEKKKFYN